MHEATKALNAGRGAIVLVAVGLLVYGLVEGVEGVGLWLAKRWAEYLTVVATAVFIPYEVYELTKAVTVTKALAFAINVAAVVYLIVAKRLFGVRGGTRAYERELEGESLLEVRAAGGDARSPPTADGTSACPTPAPGGARRSPQPVPGEQHAVLLQHLHPAGSRVDAGQRACRSSRAAGADQCGGDGEVQLVDDPAASAARNSWGPPSQTTCSRPRSASCVAGGGQVDVVVPADQHGHPGRRQRGPPAGSAAAQVTSRVGPAVSWSPGSSDARRETTATGSAAGRPSTAPAAGPPGVGRDRPVPLGGRRPRAPPARRRRAPAACGTPAGHRASPARRCAPRRRPRRPARRRS